ncbi:tape measure domain-containing protein [Canicola haemoglobinophilus]|uniref:Monofunctional biosynthetic peptidoglycan transglycosylase n=1 Tax=Canicola haemoglobinophilus TaxID=733 RepID=A0A1V4B409_9PAST|nr:tape measure protein [Canicola haemoglobinophilus]OOS02199.1 tape measure domain-containing protein [Canicola haemoglobinophilus]STO59668.1 monofunctional biosynthetic peptidoglycan transglycosylase [Canicola haemoglobinophilus]
MANNSTSFYVNLAGNVASQAGRFGQAIQGMTSRSKRALSSLKSSVQSLSNSIDSVGNRAFIGLTAGGALASRSLIKTAAEFEMAGIRMKQTFKEDGDKAMAWLKQFATDTPMAFGDVQNAAMRLKTAGIDPMNGSLQALVDYNAKIGGDTNQLNDFINSFQKMAAVNKMTWEDVLPLIQRNVPVLKMLSEATGGKYSEKQILQLIKEGRLQGKAIEALYRQMGKDAAGAAKEQMKTWDGLVSNLGDTFTSMQASFMEKGVFDELKNELGGILDWLNQKIDNGEFDEFAKQVSDTLVTALRDLKDVSKDVKPILEDIGSVMSWLSEKAGGYGNLAKFAAALYGANKIARSGLGKAALGVGKGAFGAGRWGVGKVFGKKGAKAGGVAAVGGALGSVSGVTPVFVTNFADMAVGGLANTVGGAVDKKSKTSTKQATQNTKAVAQSTKNATSGIKQTATKAIKSTATATKNMASTLAKGMKGVPALGAGLALAEGASVLMDDTASTQEKSESIGSIAGATAGAIVGQALIPIPVVGAMVGSFVGDWLGGWLGSEVGEMLASPEQQEAKLDASVEVKIKATEGLVASVGNTAMKSNRPDNSLQLQTTTGYMGRGLYGGD